LIESGGTQVQDTSFFAMFELAIGVYLLYAAAVGRGKIYENENLKIPREQYVRVMRKLCAVTGSLLTLSNLLILLGVIPEMSGMGMVLWALGLASIIVMAVYSARSSDRNAPRGGQGAKKEDRLRAAFEFDDEPAAAGEDTPGK